MCPYGSRKCSFLLASTPGGGQTPPSEYIICFFFIAQSYAKAYHIRISTFGIRSAAGARHPPWRSRGLGQREILTVNCRSTAYGPPPTTIFPGCFAALARVVPLQSQESRISTSRQLLEAVAPWPPQTTISAYHESSASVVWAPAMKKVWDHRESQRVTLPCECPLSMARRRSTSIASELLAPGFAHRSDRQLRFKAMLSQPKPNSITCFSEVLPLASDPTAVTICCVIRKS